MRQTKITIGLCIVFLVACNTDTQKKFLSDCKQVAKRKGELIVLDRSLLNETLIIQLSELTEEMQIIKLDDADEALISNDFGATITNSYIFVRGAARMAYKLFDKKTGKFITNIGAFGQGPGEYQNIYDQQVDEVNDRIYLLPWSAKQILVYDLKGNNLPPIPLCHPVPKGHFKVDTKNETVIVSALPFNGVVSAVVWQQTTKGELLKSIEPGHLAITPDFSNEMAVYKHGDKYSFSVFTFKPRNDSVYHYDVSGNRIIPVFTLDYKSPELPIHMYAENENYFFGDFSEPKQISANQTITQNHQFYIVDKNTLKGAFFVLENDFLGGKVIEWPCYQLSGEYYSRNADPGNLKDELEEILNSNKNMSPEMREKLTKLKNSITDDDNNYILFAKMK